MPVLVKHDILAIQNAYVSGKGITQALVQMQLELS